MSWLRRLTQPSKKPNQAQIGSEASQQMPIVKFDAARITKSVRADLKRNIGLCIEKRYANQVYELALQSVAGQGDLHRFCTGLLGMNMEGMTRSRAAEIGCSLNSKTGAVIERERRIALGITHAIWRYSGAPCMLSNHSNASAAELRQDAAHSAATGKQFEVRKGLFLDGKWTSPGAEDGCKCISTSVIPGLNDTRVN